MRKGIVWLRKEQRTDGSWPGFWGIHYTYGTLFGITGLLASGAKRNDEAILRACRWLVEARLAAGESRGTVYWRDGPCRTTAVR